MCQRWRDVQEGTKEILRKGRGGKSEAKLKNRGGIGGERESKGNGE